MPTESLRIPDDGALAAIADLIAAADGPTYADLYSSNTPYIPARVLADYTVASFAGYAAVGPIAWGTVFLNGGGKAESDSSLLLWSFTGSSGTAVVYGVLLRDAAATKLWGVVPFLAPIILSPSNTVIGRTIQFTGVSEL